MLKQYLLPSTQVGAKEGKEKAADKDIVAKYNLSIRSIFDKSGHPRKDARVCQNTLSARY